jgi:hypothetical protein
MLALKILVLVVVCVVVTLLIQFALFYSRPDPLPVVAPQDHPRGSLPPRQPDPVFGTRP